MSKITSWVCSLIFKILDAWFSFLCVYLYISGIQVLINSNAPHITSYSWACSLCGGWFHHARISKPGPCTARNVSLAQEFHTLNPFSTMSAHMPIDYYQSKRVEHSCGTCNFKSANIQDSSLHTGWRRPKTWRYSATLPTNSSPSGLYRKATFESYHCHSFPNTFKF